jgi:hypothetical protein
VISLKHFLPLCLCWAAMVLLGHGQAPPAQIPPPASCILDKGGYFSRDTSAFKRISEQLLKLEQDHGFKIYLVIEPVLITTSAPELAADLRQQWVPDGNGLVLVYESNNHRLGVGRDMAGGPNLKDLPNRIPSHETTAMLSRATASADPDKGSDIFVEKLIGNLVLEFEGYFKRRASPPPPERSMKIGLLVIGTLSVLGLAIIGLGALVRHSSMAGVRSFRFPVVDRPERLGAPCGSSVTSRGFGPQRPR